MGLSEEQMPDSLYSWVVLVTSSAAMVFTFGMQYSYGVFLGPLSATYGLSRVTLSTVFSIELFLFYVGASVIGLYATRIPVRRVLLASGAVTVLLAPGHFLVDSYLGLVVVFALLGTTTGSIFVILVSIVPLWFEERRGMATGVLLAGSGVGLFLLPPAWQLAFDRLGVPVGFLVIISLTGVIFLLNGAICRRPPWEPKAAVSLTELGEWLGTLTTTRRFQLLFVGKGLAFGWYYLLAAYSIELFISRGMTETVAAFTFGLIGGFSIFSRIGSGFLADRIGHQQTFFLSLGCTVVGGLLLIAESTSLLFVAVAFFGLGFGGVATMNIPILLGAYDREMGTAVIGTFNLATGLTALLAPPVGALLITASDSYVGAILVTICVALGAIASFWLGLNRYSAQVAIDGSE